MKELQEIISAKLKSGGISAIYAAENAGLKRDAIRSILRGQQPTYKRLVEVCDALNIDFYLGNSKPKPEPQHQIPVLGMAACGKDGWASLGFSDLKSTLPDRNMSIDAFAVIATGESMRPYGIFSGCICYCDPHVPIKTDQFVFVKTVKKGRKPESMTIKRLVSILPEEGYRLQGYKDYSSIEGDDGEYSEVQASYDSLVEFDQVQQIAPVCWINTNPSL